MAGIKKTNKSREEQFNALSREWDDCKKCALSETRKRVVHGSGDIDSRVLLVAEAPGKEEDRSGKPFMGAAGQQLDSLLAEAKLTRSDFFLVNTLACRPSKINEDTGYVNNRRPTPDEILACSPRLQAVFRIVDPLIVVLLGRTAADTLFTWGVPERVKCVLIFSVTHPAAYLYGDRDPSSDISTWKGVAKQIRLLDRSKPTGVDWSAVLRGQLHNTVSVKKK